MHILYIHTIHKITHQEGRTPVKHTHTHTHSKHTYFHDYLVIRAHPTATSASHDHVNDDGVALIVLTSATAQSARGAEE